jgi:hypothetical protein
MQEDKSNNNYGNVETIKPQATIEGKLHQVKIPRNWGFIMLFIGFCLGLTAGYSLIQSWVSALTGGFIGGAVALMIYGYFR